MFLKTVTMKSTSVCWDNIARRKWELDTADAVVIGAGAGLSISAGFTCGGERFHRCFFDRHCAAMPPGIFCSGDLL